jgi:DNA-binding ferritin-like protein (Dps family)
MPCGAANTFTNEDLNRYRGSSGTEPPPTSVNDICTRAKKPGLLTEYEIRTLLRQAESLRKSLDITSDPYEMLTTCMDILDVEQDIRNKEHEAVTGSDIEKAVENYNQDYWCTWGNHHRNEVQRAEEEVQRAKRHLDQVRRDWQWQRVDRSRVKIAEEMLKDAKIDLRDTERSRRQFEDRAYRQNIPATWYRCQYE